MSVAAAVAGGLRGSMSCFAVSMDDSLHCVQAGGADPDSLIIVFRLSIIVFPYPDIGAKIQCPDFRILINNPTANYSPKSVCNAIIYIVPIASVYSSAVATGYMTGHCSLL